MRLFLFLAIVAVVLSGSGCKRAASVREKVAEVDAGEQDSGEQRSSAQLVQIDELARASRASEGELGQEQASATSTLFRELSPETSGLDFQLTLRDPVKHIRVLTFLNAYGGVCTGDYDGDGLTDVYLTSPQGGNRLFRNLGGMRFEDVSESAGLFRPDFWGTGASFVDVDNDGDLDIYACGYDMPNQLWINDGGKFTERAEAFGLNYRGASMTMSFADIDNDGDLDGYLATTALQPPPGTKFGVVFEDGKPVVPPQLREYWDLVYLPGDRAVRVESAQYDHLFRNDGDRFVEITDSAGIDGNFFTLSATWWDYDGDGWQDLYVSNDYTGPDKLYRNNRDGKFRDVIQETVAHTPWFSMGSDVGDLNNDGLIDFFASDMSATSHYREKVMMGNMDSNAWFLDFAEPRQFMRNAVYLNSGTIHPFEIAFQAGLSSSDWTWSPRLEDFDNDGHVDVFATNGILRDMMNSDLSALASERFEDGSPEWAKFWAEQPMHKESNVAFRNTGKLKFQPVASNWGLDRKGVSFGAATADFDNDGDLDLIVTNADTKASLYENRSSKGHRAIFRLRGSQSNHFGVGAVVQVEAEGVTRARAVTLSRGWLSASDPSVHFGLGDASRIDRVTIRWPGGKEQVLTDLPVDRCLTITEPTTFPADDRSNATTRFTERITSASHVENEFDDFSLQPLLPNRQSQWGPAFALGDVDSDGDDDVYLGGAAGRPGMLFRNQQGELQESEQSPWSSHAEHEDTAAVFFDADQDQDLDLYVVSGSNEWQAGARQYRDRLYWNDGSGSFTEATSGLPENFDSGSCVVAMDFDQDGDQDLFVGGRGLPGAYPLSATSRLLRNDGKMFSDVSPECFQSLGIVTDAVWVDVNQDQRPDLVVATEWGPVRCLLNQEQGFTDATKDWQLDRNTGWWNTIAAADLDGDGDMDLVAGNFGLNTKYKASPQKPELLYYGDLDGTGKPHIVEAKFEADRCLPRRGFSCSKNAMPFLDQKMGTFHQFASATLPELYSQSRLDQCQKFEINTLQSGVFWNDVVNSKGRFEFQPLPYLAQVAPCLGIDVTDVDQDGHPDIVMAQNFYPPQRETGRMAGGLSLLLRSGGDGTFHVVWPGKSGIQLRQDTRQVITTDWNQDGQPDLVFAANNGPLRILLNQGDGK